MVHCLFFYLQCWFAISEIIKYHNSSVSVIFLAHKYFLVCSFLSCISTPVYWTKYSRMDQVEFFKGCLPQISFGPFLNTLSHISPCISPSKMLNGFIQVQGVDSEVYDTYKAKSFLNFERSKFLQDDILATKFCKSLL